MDSKMTLAHNIVQLAVAAKMVTVFVAESFLNI